MEKKVIAIVGAVVLLISVFAACAKKPTIKGNNGIEYAVVTDDEGNTVINEDGEVVIYVTDEHGKYVKDGNGERQTNYIEFPDSIINGNTYETADYVLTFPEENWTVLGSGTYTKKDTNDKVTIKIVSLGKLEMGQNLESIVSKAVDNNNIILEEIKEEIEKENYDVNMNVTDVHLTAKNAPAKVVDFIFKDNEGKIIFHSFSAYYISNGKSFKIEYTCNDADFNDTAEDIVTLINESLTIKGAAG